MELYPLAELEQVGESLTEIAAAWASSEELRRALLNPAFRVEDRVSALSSLFSRVRPGDQRFTNLASLLVDNGRAKAIPEIAEAFVEMVAELKKLLSLEITSARLVDESERTALQGAIAKEFGSLASVSWAVKQELIGGLMVRSGDKMLDGSVRGSLERIRSQLVG